MRPLSVCRRLAFSGILDCKQLQLGLGQYLMSRLRIAGSSSRKNLGPTVTLNCANFFTRRMFSVAETVRLTHAIRLIRIVTVNLLASTICFVWDAGSIYHHDSVIVTPAVSRSLQCRATSGPYAYRHLRRTDVTAWPSSATRIYSGRHWQATCVYSVAVEPELYSCGQCDDTSEQWYTQRHWRAPLLRCITRHFFH